MTQISKYPLSKAVADRIFEVFLNTFVEIKNTDDADKFISDFLTPTEKIMLSKRLAIAFLLEKKYDYRTIQKIVRVSAPTITTVNNARQYGNEGYRKLITKILKEEKLVQLLDDAVIKLLSAPAALEKGKGTWTYLKGNMEKKKKKTTSSPL